jgi:hypothetical protein
MRPMAGRAARITSRVVFFLCGLVSLLTAAPYVLLRGEDLPVESEWILFVIALALVGGFSVAIAVLPAAWTTKVSRKQPDDGNLFVALLKPLAAFAVIAYLLAVGAYFSPRSWNLNPQLMLILCPMYLIKMSFDPPPLTTFFLLAPMNAGAYGSLGLMLRYAWLALRRQSADK